MFLFRPSNNNQRYAFVPLLDPSDNEDDEFNEDEEKGGKDLPSQSIAFFSSLRISGIRFHYNAQGE